MPQFSITTTTTTTITTTITSTTHHFSSILISYILLFCSLIISHPLYFSYFIFFSPYLLKLLSFLSPLFITTFLFLLAFLTIHNNPLSESSESKVGIFLSSYKKVLNKFSWSLDEENVHNFHLLEQIEACMVVLDNDIHNSGFPYLSNELESYVADKAGEFLQNKSEEAITLPELSHTQPSQLTSNFHVADHPLTKHPACSDTIEHIVAKQPSGNVKEKKENLEMLYSTDLTPCGSMRKDKEWKRTLACKLYEERQNIGGSEGMDLLWEEDEADSTKVKKTNKNKVKKEMEYDEEEDEDDEIDVKLCCLQALKFSTRKMNMGVRRPNLVKISKALKGIGWFHHVSKSSKERIK